MPTLSLPPAKVDVAQLLTQSAAATVEDAEFDLPHVVVSLMEAAERMGKLENGAARKQMVMYAVQQVAPSVDLSLVSSLIDTLAEITKHGTAINALATRCAAFCCRK